MPDKQITELSSGGSVSDTDLLLTRQNSTTEDKKISASQIKSYIEASFNVDNLTDGTANTFMKVGNGLDSLASYNAIATYLEGDIAIGKDATAGIDGAAAADHKNIAIGHTAASSGRYSIAVGREAIATGLNSVALGDSANASGSKSVVLGNDSSATGSASIAIKGGATADSAVAILGLANAQNSIAIGGSSSHQGSIVIGNGNSSSDENQFVISGKILVLDGIGNVTRTQLESNNPAISNKRSIQFVYNTRTTANTSPGLAISDDDTWHYLPAASAYLGGDEFFGQVTFTGTDHAGIVLNSLTTTQRDALTAAEGMMIYNSSLTAVQAYQEGSWVSVGSSAGVGGAVDSVNSQTGTVVLDADDIDDTSTTHKFATTSQLSAIDTLGSLASQDDIAITDITATGTANSSTFLRGDGTWATPAGGGGGDLLAANNLSDLNDSDTALTNLGFTATIAELNYTDGVTSNIQTQLNTKADSASLAAVATSGNYSDLSNTPTIPSAISELTDDSEFVQSNVSAVTGADAISNMISLTQAEYNAIGTPSTSTLYIITDAS